MLFQDNFPYESQISREHAYSLSNPHDSKTSTPFSLETINEPNISTSYLESLDMEELTFKLEESNKILDTLAMYEPASNNAPPSNSLEYLILLIPLKKGKPKLTLTDLISPSAFFDKVFSTNLN